VLIYRQLQDNALNYKYIKDYIKIFLREKEGFFALEGLALFSPQRKE
jgi:hypothetical protein